MTSDAQPPIWKGWERTGDVFEDYAHLGLKRIRRVFDHPCPACGAPAWESCRARTGPEIFTQWPHAVRGRLV